jgi:hypothetical protein
LFEVIPGKKSLAINKPSVVVYTYGPSYAGEVLVKRGVVQASTGKDLDLLVGQYCT